MLSVIMEKYKFGIQIWKKKVKVMKVWFYVSLHNYLCRTDTPLPICHSTPNNIRNIGQILLPWITLIILTHVKWWWSESCSVIIRLFATSWTIRSTEFSRPAYWSGWLFPSPGHLLIPGIEPGLPHCWWIL